MIGTSVESRTADTGDIERQIQAELIDAADVGFAKSQEDAPTDTGNLTQSGVPPEPRRDGSVVWGYNAPYALAVEFGSEPHTPPLEPLERWGQRVLGSKEAGRAVWAKIREEGTQPQPFVRPGIEAMREALQTRDVGARIEAQLSLD